MFPRISRSTKKSVTYEYLVISESIRIKGKGSTTRDIANLGNIKKISSSDIEKIIDGFIRIFKLEKYALTDDVKIIESLEHGSIIFWQNLWNKMCLSESIRNLIKLHNNYVEIDVAKYIEIMVINRCVDPLSKLGMSRWINSTSFKAMKGYNNLNINVEYFYRSMDYLLSIKDELELTLYERLKNLFSINVKLTFYDITSTFFHTETCPIAKKGYSRDHRPDKEQIVIGVVTSWEGYPIKHYVFEGNTKDDQTVIDVVKQLKTKFRIGETTFVGDRGMITKLNLSTIEKEGFDYIIGVKHRQSELHEMLLDEDVLNIDSFEDYKQLKIYESNNRIKDFLLWKIKTILKNENINIDKIKYNMLENTIESLNNNVNELKDTRIKDIIMLLTENKKIYRKIYTLIKKYIGQYDNKYRSIVCLNKERKELSKKIRKRKIENISELLTKLFQKFEERQELLKIESKINEIFSKNNRRYKKYFKIHRNKTDTAVGYELNKKEIIKEEKYDGIFIIATNSHTMDARQIIDAYKNLQEVEILFDDLKNFVDINPLRHWLEKRVKSHVFICILSLLLKRIFEIDCLHGKSLMQPLEEINKCKLIRYEVKFSEKEDRRQIIPKVTQTTELQKKIFKLVGITNPMNLEKIVW